MTRLRIGFMDKNIQVELGRDVYVNYLKTRPVAYNDLESCCL